MFVKQFFLAFFIAFFTYVALPANAQSSRWAVSAGEAKICTPTSAGGCVTMACAPDGKISYSVNGPGIRPGTGQIIIDKRTVGRGQFNGTQGNVSVLLDPKKNAGILAAMGAGNRMRASINGRNVDVTLKGSSVALARLRKACTQRVAQAVVTQIEAENWAKFERRTDETTVTMGAVEIPLQKFTTTRDADIWGGDIRSGLDDPLLKGMTKNACALLCIATDGCGAFTWNGKDGNVCFLKTGA